VVSRETKSRDPGPDEAFKYKNIGVVYKRQSDDDLTSDDPDVDWYPADDGNAASYANNYTSESLEFSCLPSKLSVKNKEEREFGYKSDRQDQRIKYENYFDSGRRFNADIFHVHRNVNLKTAKNKETSKYTSSLKKRKTTSKLGVRLFKDDSVLQYVSKVCWNYTL